MATDCIIRNNFKNKKEYARIFVNGKYKLAYRYFYEKRFGKIPKGMVCDHLCRNPQCINLEHIEIVTPRENTRRGNSAKLNFNIVEEIRKIYKSKKITQTQLALQYGVGQHEISRIINARRWA